METTLNLLSTDIVIDNEAQAHLKESAMWAKLLGIVGYIYSVIIVIAAIAVGYTFSNLPSYSSSSSLYGGGVIVVVYLIMAVVSFFMSLTLYRFAARTQEALKANDQQVMNEGLKNLKSFFRIAGILTIIMLVFTVLGLIGIIMAQSFSYR